MPNNFFQLRRPFEVRNQRQTQRATQTRQSTGRTYTRRPTPRNAGPTTVTNSNTEAQNAAQMQEDERRRVRENSVVDKDEGRGGMEGQVDAPEGVRSQAVESTQSEPSTVTQKLDGSVRSPGDSLEATPADITHRATPDPRRLPIATPKRKTLRRCKRMSAAASERTPW